MIEHKPTNAYIKNKELSIFLAGTIDDGASENWQAELATLLTPYDVTLFNPRRDDWNPDSTVEDLKDQINWEMDALEDAKMIIMYITPTSKSPISLLELGLYSKRPITVCCPEGFWRKTNVDVVCERYGIPLFDDKDKFFNRIVDFVKQETGFINEPTVKKLIPNSQQARRTRAKKNKVRKHKLHKVRNKRKKQKKTSK